MKLFDDYYKEQHKLAGGGPNSLPWAMAVQEMLNDIKREMEDDLEDWNQIFHLYRKRQDGIVEDVEELKKRTKDIPHGYFNGEDDYQLIGYKSED